MARLPLRAAAPMVGDEEHLIYQVLCMPSSAAENAMTARPVAAAAAAGVAGRRLGAAVVS